MLELLGKKYSIELSQGVGKEVGKFEFDHLLEKSAQHSPCYGKSSCGCLFVSTPTLPGVKDCRNINKLNQEVNVNKC